MNYGTLKADLAQMLGRQALSLSYSLATEDMNTGLRILGMEKTVLISVDAGSITLPNDFLEPQSLRIAGGSFFVPTSYDRLADCPPANGYVVGNGTALFAGPVADGVEVELIYFARIPDLINDEDTNAALNGGAKQAFIYSVLAHHSKLIRNMEAHSLWAPQAAAQIGEANARDTKVRHSGGPLVVSVGEGALV